MITKMISNNVDLTELDSATKELTNAISSMPQKLVIFIFNMAIATRLHVTKDIPENASTLKEVIANGMRTVGIFMKAE